MRILIISDIHANLTALDAVLNHIGQVDAVWCLGDLVGYGPDPNDCISRIRNLPNLVCLLGNHDAAALDQIETDSFNPDARLAILWTREQLTEESTSFLKTLPEKAVVDHVTLAHGSPRQPVWEYLLDTRTATVNFEHFETPYCLVGHTHLPVLYHLPDESRVARLIVPDAFMQLTLAPRAILNPGSVGQPRDRDPRAAYSIFDSTQNTYEFSRVPYNISAVQARMEDANLPERHIQRLSSGW
jgi:diadenosine tetraphosphatase ApaH/serine/threonine PP2A family protein phosphatase